jgi:hypothetical protein
MHKNATKCNETLSKWYKNKHGASKIIDTFETYQPCFRLALWTSKKIQGGPSQGEGRHKDRMWTHHVYQEDDTLTKFRHDGSRWIWPSWPHAQCHGVSLAPYDDIARIIGIVAPHTPSHNIMGLDIVASCPHHAIRFVRLARCHNL